MEQKELEQTAQKMRRLVVDAIYHAKSGHPGGSLSICDIMSALFFQEMKLDPKNPQKEDRDRFVLSKGHAAPAYYAALVMRDYFPEEELKHLRNIHSFLQGHPCLGKVPGVDMSTGSLGQGLSAANGMALAAKAEQKDYRVYCICGDGELQEGQIWEAAMTAAHYHLDNLTLFVDHNGLQIDGNVKDVMDCTPVAEKFQAFGWHTITIDGHNMAEILAALEEARKTKDCPTAIIAKTVKGKGVSFMENQAGWHGAAPDEAQYQTAMAELEG